jgi:DNA-binding GntR family transcriptional regulator
LAEVIELASHPRSLAMPITPSYQRIVDDIRSQIASGKLAPGAQLPTGQKLMADYHVGNTAVRNALLVLKTQGLIDSQQGKGVYVTADALTRL